MNDLELLIKDLDQMVYFQSIKRVINPFNIVLISLLWQKEKQWFYASYNLNLISRNDKRYIYIYIY